MKHFAISAALAAALAVAACGNQSDDIETAETEAVTPGAETNPMESVGMDNLALGELSAQRFVSEAAVSNMLEIEASRVALEKTQNPEVREYAQMMVTDHTCASAELQKLAAQAAVAAPDSLTDDAREKVEGLRTADAAGFDDAYLDLMVDSHEEAVALFERAAQENAEPADAVDTTTEAFPAPLQQFAQATLPTLRTHLQRAEALQGEAGDTMTNGAAPQPRT